MLERSAHAFYVISSAQRPDEFTLCSLNWKALKSVLMNTLTEHLNTNLPHIILQPELNERRWTLLFYR